MTDQHEDKDRLFVAPEVMDATDVAAWLSVSERHVVTMAKDGEIPATKIATKWRFPKSALEEWLRDLALQNLNK